MIVLDRIDEVRAACDAARKAGASVGLVPTMGSFHAGHASLMQAARSDTGFVVVSLFVNPLQFGAGEDLAAYPRDPEGDGALAAGEGVDVLFTPPVGEMYPAARDGGPPRLRTVVHVDGLTEGLCGAARPGHFDGVTTVVAKLFSVVGPCRAYFGRKDAQQLAVVRRMAADLDLPVDVVDCPLVREPDGLAMSSRNRYLGADDRRAATVLSRALRQAADLVVDDERDATTIARRIEAVVTSEPRASLEYAAVVDAAELAPIDEIAGDVLIAVAARVGPTRLIDNVGLRVNHADVDVDLGVVTAAHASASGGA